MDFPNQPELAQRVTVFKMREAISKVGSAIQHMDRCKRINPNNERFGAIINELTELKQKMELELDTIHEAQQGSNISANNLDPGFQ